MVKLKTNKLPDADNLRAETVIDRSTRISRQILKDEVEQRELKTARLRRERLEKEAGLSSNEPESNPQGERKKT